MSDFKQGEIAEYLRQLLDANKALEARVKQLEQSQSQWGEPQVPYAGSSNALDPQRYEVCVVSSLNPARNEIIGYRTYPTTLVNTPWTRDPDLGPIVARVPYGKPLPDLNESVLVVFSGVYGSASTPLYGHFPSNNALILVQLEEELIHRTTETYVDDVPSAACVKVRYNSTAASTVNPNEYIASTTVASVTNPDALIVYFTTGFRRENPDATDRDYSFGYGPLNPLSPTDGKNNVLKAGDRAYATYNVQSARYEFVQPAETIVRFQLTEPLPLGGVAQAYLVIEEDGNWIVDEYQQIPVWDRLSEWGGGHLGAGCRGYAKRFGDTGQWEILFIQSTCGSVSAISLSPISSSRISSSSPSSRLSSGSSPSPSPSPSPSAIPPVVSSSPSSPSSPRSSSSSPRSSSSRSQSSPSSSPSECTIDYIWSLLVNFDDCTVFACTRRLHLRAPGLVCEIEELGCGSSASGV